MADAPGPGSGCMTMFSVVMTTRNRPALFAAALASVRMQTGADFEIVVVMDGSAPEHDAAYAEVLGGLAAPVIRLDATRRGHGQSYAINRGAAVARGDYLCFLDDDDVWTDARYLARAAASLGSSGAELYLANQVAYRGETVVAQAGGVWLEQLGEQPRRLGAADAQGARAVTPDVLMAVPRHCHLNTTIIRRALFDAIGGMDEEIRWDCDRDFYMRAVDRAEGILYAGVVVARHNVPDPAAKASITTATPVLERLLYQARVFDKAMLFARRPAVAAHGRWHKAYVLRHLATLLAADGRRDLAAAYAWAALGTRPSVKWLAYCVWLGVRRRFRR